MYECTCTYIKYTFVHNAKSSTYKYVLTTDASAIKTLYFPCSADHEQNWQPYPVDPYSDDQHTSIHTVPIYV